MYLLLMQRYRGLGDGEAAAITIAARRGGTVVTEDGLAKRVCDDRLVAWEGVGTYFERMVPNLL